MPCRWGQEIRPALGDWATGRPFAGRVRFTRHFGQPTRIDPHERVWLTFAGVNADTDVSLNGHHLGSHTTTSQQFEFEITDLLQARNELRVEVASAIGETELWSEVALEVRCTAFLRHIRAWTEGTILHVAGEVVGSAERPLDLYVLLDGARAAYDTVTASEEGQPFRLTVADVIHASGIGSGTGVPPVYHQLRIELINGGVLWYAKDQVLTS